MRARLRKLWQLLLWGGLVASFSSYWGCDEPMPTAVVRVAPEIVSIDIVEPLYAESPERPVRVLVRVDDPQGPADLVSARLSVSDLSGRTLSSIDLVDDGSAGDILPRDGLFLARITSAFAGGQPGSYRVEATATDRAGNTSPPFADTVQVQPGRAGLPPELAAITAPEVVFADSVYDFVISVEVVERPEDGDVDRVEYALYPPMSPVPAEEGVLFDDGSSGDVFPRDRVYTRTFSSQLGSKLGVYSFRVEAVNAAGLRSLPEVAYVRLLDRRVNQPPRIFNLQAPDTLSRSAQPNLYTLSVQVSDPDGLGDIARVFFNSFLPDGTPASGNPFLMRDDGKGGDAVAADGRYSLTIQIDNSAPLGNFLFEFQAEDSAGNLSNKIAHVLTVIP